MATLKTQVNNKPSFQFFALTNGVSFDQRLFHEEVFVQREWLKSIRDIKVINDEELKKLDQGLQQAEELNISGIFPWEISEEDIHMNLERFLTESCGDCAKKIHIGRSRNDLIATTLRLFIRNQSHLIQKKLNKLANAVLDKAAEFAPHITPAYTHMQAAQPIRMGQIFLSYGFWMTRDMERYSDVMNRSMKYMPLGSAAINGTHLDIDLSALAQRLGFEGPSLCSYDAVGDRDFLQDFAGCSSILAGHLSRMCNDIIFLSSTPVSAIVLPGEWSSGSSIMPNKRNPDLFEIIRAKSARVMAGSNELNTVLHSIPSGYTSDLHETKQILSKIIDEVHLCLDALRDAVAKLAVNVVRLKQLLCQGHILATDMANAEVASGKSFRDSYKDIAAIVARAEKEQCQVHELEGRHTFQGSVESRDNLGGNSLRQIERSISVLRKRLS